MVALAKGQRLNQFKYADRVLARANPFGNVRYLDSQNGNDGNDGDSPMHPVQTLARALALMDAGDTLVLDPGGSETVTAAVAIALARVRIVCPVLNPEQGFTISGAGTLNLLNPTAADITIEGVKFAHTGATSDQAGILAAAGADRLHVKNCIFDDSAITTTFTGAGVEITDACNGVLVEGCRFKDCQFGVLSIVATGIVQAGLEIRSNEFWIGQAAAFGIATALSGTGALRGLVATGNKFMELNGSGAAATAAWDGTNGANATQGPIKLEAAADQYLIAGNSAFTAGSVSFANLNAIASGAAGTLTANTPGAFGKLTGTTDIDDSVQDESAAWFVLNTIAPAADAPLRNCRIVFDLAKATTGYAAVESTATIQLRIARKIDGTNWRGQAAQEAALSGTLAAGRCQTLDIGPIGVGEQVRIEAIMSADATADMELPYVFYYEGEAAPTITDVAAG